MAYLRLVTPHLAIVAALLLVVAQIKIPAKILKASSDGGLYLRDSCPYQEDLDTAVKNISDSVFDILQQMFSSQIPQCGNGLWYRVAYLNMSDPSQQCPSAWREQTQITGVRVCARPNSTEGSCPSVLFPVGGQYSKVCGRVIGYQFGSPDAFVNAVSGPKRNMMIDESYLDGISITHGTSKRTHIWSYAAGATENGSCSASYNCPCSNSNYNPPSYIGNNYYCESANKDDCIVANVFFPNDPLWDGQQCDYEGTCCNAGNSTQPWFSVDLSKNTNDDVEVRICHDQNTIDEDTPIQLLELYVQ